MVLTTTAPVDGRQRVLNAAAERFVAQGYAATTLRQIAADVGMIKPIGADIGGPFVLGFPVVSVTIRS